MEFANPRGFDDFIIFGVAFQFAHFALVDVGFDIVAEVGQEEDLPLAVPQKRMIQNISKHGLSAVFTATCTVDVFFRFALDLVKDKVEKLQILFMTVCFIFQFLVQSFLAKDFAFMDYHVKQSDQVQPELKSRVVR